MLAMEKMEASPGFAKPDNSRTLSLQRTKTNQKMGTARREPLTLEILRGERGYRNDSLQMDPTSGQRSDEEGLTEHSLPTEHPSIGISSLHIPIHPLLASFLGQYL